MHLMQVVALDADLAENGTVRYSARARGPARGLLRVHATTGRLYASPRLQLRPGDSYDVTIRACDGGSKPRCGVARAGVRGTTPGGGRPPKLAAVPPLQAAELDAPPFLLAVLQATDPEHDPLYYDIVGGDDRQEFYIGREDGSLVLARRLLWERQAHYSLNISVTDGLNVVTTLVNITVINDANEGGVSFSREEYVVEAAESLRVGEALAVLQAHGAGRLLYGLHEARAPASLKLFRLHELTGVLELAQPLDRESAAQHEITLAEARIARNAAPGTLVTVLRAADPDAGDAARIIYSLAGGDSAGLFEIEPALGEVRLSRALPSRGQRDFTITVRASNPPPSARASTLPLHVIIVDPDPQPPRFTTSEAVWSVYENEPAGASIGALEARGGAGVWYSLEGGRGMFRLNPSAGALATAAPLDYEALNQYNLTVTAQGMGGGMATAKVVVHVLDRNEFPPVLLKTSYRGRISEAAPIGSLVTALDSDDPGAPLVLETEDGDSPANRQKAYEILEPEAMARFHIDPTTGALRIAALLDYEETALHEFTVKVVDMGTPRLPSDSVAKVTIEVTDVNDCPPRFSSPSYEATVLLPTARGVAVIELPASDPDLPAGKTLKYDIIEGDSDGAFSMTPDGTLMIERTDDLSDTYRLRVRASDGQYAGTTRVKVRVRSADNAGLAFHKADYYGSVLENSTKPATVAVLNVLGAALNEHIEFKILNPVEGFEADYYGSVLENSTKPATVAVLNVLGAALNEHIEFKILNPVEGFEADYYGSVLENSTKPATVAVLNVLGAALNEHIEFKILNPVEGFEADYYGSVLENSTKPATVAVLNVLGAALNEHIEFKILNPVEGFEVDYYGSVLENSTKPATVAVLNVLGAALNEHIEFKILNPVEGFEVDYYGSVLENSTKPATVAVLNVLGAALNEHIEFKILNPVEGFEVGLTSGAVRSTGVALDREQRDSYTLLLQARGGSSASETARVAHARLHISVTDVNDNCPVFVERPYVAAVLAGAEPGAPVIRVQAIDADANDNGEVRYEMKRGHGELFRVDRRSGQISLKQTLDAHNQLYTLVIAAFDGGVPACGSEATVSVRVWGGGAAPRWEKAHYTLTAREDIPPGDVITPPLRAHSPLGRQLIYTLVDADPPVADLFEIHFDTGSVVARAPLDYEVSRSHALTVRATDGVTGAYADASVTLRVTDVNDCAPELDRDLYRASVSEAAAIGELVVVVQATDNDTGVNGEIIYSLSKAVGSDNESLALFSIEETTGAVRVAAPLDAELRSQHHLVVTATDKGRPPLHTTAHLFITVDDVNDNEPRLERTVVSALVSAEATRGTVVARVAAWDPDARDANKLRLAIAGGAERAAFDVDPHSGLLTLSDEIAWNRQAGSPGARSLNVSATDGAHAVFARVKLQPAPANRAPPHFPHVVHEARAMDNQPPPVLLTTVKAYDDDIGEYGTITYSIPSAKLRETFSIDANTGALTTKVVLDRETRAEWEVGVTASDGGGLLKHTVVRVRVADTNDNAPIFPLGEYRAAVRSDRAPHAPFLTLAAKDADAGENAKLTYSVYEGDVKSDASGLFHVDLHSGALSFARNASQFASRAVQVWVRARDSGGLAGEAPVSVFVLGPDDISPRVTPPPPAVFLPEDAAPGTLIVELRAEPPIPKYRLAPGLWPRDLFAIDSAGRLVLAGQLDRETQQDHIIGIIAEGEGSPAPAILLQTKLHVLDVNEHAPAFHSQPYIVHVAENTPPHTSLVQPFHSQPYIVHVAENTPPHTSLVQLMADDPDAGSNGEVRFSLANEADAATFAVDPYTGWVTTVAALDREAKPEHRVAVLAHDNGVTRRTTRGTLIVRLMDYNDCPPVFSEHPDTVSVSEDAAAGTVVTRLEVEDADSTGSPLTFLVASGDPRARFQLRATGELLVARPLDRETEDSYSLTIAATDGKFTAYTTVNITVLDVNDNPPYCLRHRYSARLPEDAAVGTRVAVMLTADNDLPSTPGRPAYHLAGEHHHHFHVHKDTGVISVASPLDRETISKYSLEAIARDRERDEWGCSSELVVEIDDVNDNAPRFSAEEYSVTLPEDADLGTLVAKVTKLCI
ncbi:cadherin domain-containing protein [Phthorimaea operculella]|nr:cadherin domain-containing protein [Phthorimaea operculella]